MIALGQVLDLPTSAALALWPAIMIAIRGLFESHLTVSDLDRSVEFYRDVLQLPLARIFPDRRVAFFWVGAPGQAMLGIWEAGTGPQRLSLHLAFEVSVEGVLASVEALVQAGITPLDIAARPTQEPVVLAWMPAVTVYFHDPDGNLLEFLAMLPHPPRPELGVMPWSSWLVTCPFPAGSN
jgi:lactoylglutathione lyase